MHGYRLCISDAETIVIKMRYSRTMNQVPRIKIMKEMKILLSEHHLFYTTNASVQLFFFRKLAKNILMNNICHYILIRFLQSLHTMRYMNRVSHERCNELPGAPNIRWFFPFYFVLFVYEGVTFHVSATFPEHLYTAMIIGTVEI